MSAPPPTSSLTWPDARALALSGQLVRREVWNTTPSPIIMPDVLGGGLPTLRDVGVRTWIGYHAALWYAYNQNQLLMEVVTAADFTAEDENASDWTTDPVGTTRDVCTLPPPQQQFQHPSISLEIGDSSLSCHIGGSSPHGPYSLEFFLNGVSVGLLYATDNSATSCPCSIGFGQIDALVKVTSQLPLPAWSDTLTQVEFIPQPYFEASSVADGATVNITNTAGVASLTYSAGLAVLAISSGATIHNPLPAAVTLTIAGSCDDDVMFNGQVYEPDSYGWLGFNGTLGHGSFLPGGGGFWMANPVGHRNGGHSFTYTTTLAPGASLLIQGQDNGQGGNISATVTVS